MTTDKLNELRMWAAKLESQIQDEAARKHLLGPAKNYLGDVERKAAPGIETHMLPIIDKLLANAQEAVDKYGPGVRVVGGK